MSFPVLCSQHAPRLALLDPASCGQFWKPDEPEQVRTDGGAFSHRNFSTKKSELSSSIYFNGPL